MVSPPEQGKRIDSPGLLVTASYARGEGHHVSRQAYWFFFLKSPRFQASKNCFHASGLKMFMGGCWPM